jgi:dolichol-phosphate mannosyltransferase
MRSVPYEWCPCRSAFTHTSLAFFNSDLMLLHEIVTTRDSHVSIVVPTFGEAENLRPLVTRISQVMSQAKQRYEIIFVDDDSHDGTDQIVSELSRLGYPVRLITRFGERGLSSAVIRGFAEADGDTLICMDADLSHPPEAIPEMLDSLSEPGVDFVIGSRYVAGARTDERWGLLRWINSKVATILARPFTSIKDPMAGFFCLHRDVYEKAAQLNPVGYKIGLELLVKCQCSVIREIPIYFAKRQFGESKLTLTEQMKYLRHLKRLLDFKYGNASRLMQFCLVGGTGVIVDLALYRLLQALGIPIDGARALAIAIAMTWNFFLNRRLTFSLARNSHIAPQYIRFVISCSLGAMVSWSVHFSLVRSFEVFSSHVTFAALLGIVCGTLSNFLISLGWVFKPQIFSQDRQPKESRWMRIRT